MMETGEGSSGLNSPKPNGLIQATVVGVLIVVAAVSHAMLTSTNDASKQPIYVDTIVGDFWVKERGATERLQCDGFKIECYESFVIVYVDKQRQPSWTQNMAIIYPLSKIEHLSTSGLRPKL